MKELKKEPIFFRRNRVFRVYSGGKLFHNFFGDKAEDGNYPEEWVVSGVKALNKNPSSPKEGISITEDGTYFDDLIASYPAEMLGDCKGWRVLVKILDSAIRLPAQAHPDREFSRKYFATKSVFTFCFSALAMCAASLSRSYIQCTIKSGKRQQRSYRGPLHYERPPCQISCAWFCIAVSIRCGSMPI